MYDKQVLCRSLSLRLAPVLVATILLCPSQALPQEVVGERPEQVSVSVKIVEWQFTKGTETGLSAFFQKQSRGVPFGRVSNGITTADLTFPTATAAGITIFLDRIRLTEGAMEIILQALQDENRAFILSRPRVQVPIGAAKETRIETSQEIPYEDTIVIGAKAVQVTKFESTGVIFTVKALEIIDDDNNWITDKDTYIKLELMAEVKEEGQRVVVALDDEIASSGVFTQAQNAIRVPEFISRTIKTTVWVRHGQVLILGGLFRNTKSTSVRTLPWLTQTENAALGFLERLPLGKVLSSPISSVLGNRSKTESRRELVFLIKSEVWRPSFTVMGDFDVMGDDDEETPADIITGVVENIGDLPQGIGEETTGEDSEDNLKSKAGSQNE